MNDLSLIRSTSVALLCWLSLSSSNGPWPEHARGDWAGWMYFDEGGDMPIRLHVEERDGESVGTIRFPSEDLPVVDVKCTIDDGQLARIELEGFAVELHGPLGDSAIELEIDWNGKRAVGEIVRSPLPLVTLEAASADPFTGAYRTEDGASFVIDRWYWGELRCTELETGRTATLFPLSEQTFLFGSGMYCPDRAEAIATFLPRQAGDSFDLLWTREGSTPVLARRKVLRELPFAFESDGAVLEGTLVLPAERGEHPCAVLLGGASSQTREKLLQLARTLALSGVAALAYDARGYGQSTGQPDVPFLVSARDALAAVEAVREHAEVRSDGVGITGESRGGWIAPLAASLTDELAFLVLWVAPMISPAEQETTRRLNLLRAEGHSAEDLELARTYLDRLWEYARSGSAWDDYFRLRQEVVARGMGAIAGPDSPLEEQWTWLSANGDYDPRPALRRLQLPIFALYAEGDTNVTPEDNLQLLRSSLPQPNRLSARVIPGVGHTFTTTNGGQRQHRRTGMAPERYRLPLEWLHQLALSVVPRAAED